MIVFFLGFDCASDTPIRAFGHPYRPESFECLRNSGKKADCVCECV